jgi:hypothetical protein
VPRNPGTIDGGRGPGMPDVHELEIVVRALTGSATRTPLAADCRVTWIGAPPCSAAASRALVSTSRPPCFLCDRWLRVGMRLNRR